MVLVFFQNIKKQSTPCESKDLVINGFVESAEFLGIDISPNEEYFKYGEAILKPIYDLNRKDRTEELMWNCEYVPAENLGVKNAKWDKEDGYFVPRDCYNSYFYRVEDDGTNLIDKFILHGNKLTQYLDGGQLKRCWAALKSRELYQQVLFLFRIANGEPKKGIPCQAFQNSKRKV